MCAFAQDYSADAKGMTDEAYSVISAYLRGQLAGKNGVDDIRVGESGSVLAPETKRWKTPQLGADERIWMKRELQGLQDQTLDSLEACSGTSFPFRSQLSLPVAYQVASLEEISSIEKLYAKYPKARGYVQFSCVGINTSKTQALFFVERNMCHCAVGKFVMLEKNNSGEWEIKHEMLRWIG